MFIASILKIKMKRKLFYISVIIFIIVQIIICISNTNFIPSFDQQTYLNLAKDAILNKGFYPSVNNYHDLYSFAPGYINILILYHNIFGTFKYFYFLNIILSCVILFDIFYISRKIFSENVAMLAVVLAMLTYSNWFIPIGYFTELPFQFCVMNFLALIICTERIRYCILGTIFLALGNWIRPIGILYISIAIFILMMATEINYKKIFAIILPYVILLICIGMFTKSQSNVFSYQSTTCGINLIGTANSKAKGFVDFSYDEDPFYYDKITLEKTKDLNFLQKDKLFRNLAIEWIFQNPIAYLSQMPLKIVIMLGFDTWSERFEKNSGLSQIKSTLNSIDAKVKFVFSTVCKSFIYYVCLFLFLIYVFKNLKYIFDTKNSLIILVFLIVCSHLVFMVTDRYHYPIMPFLWIYAAAQLNVLLKTIILKVLPTKC